VAIASFLDESTKKPPKVSAAAEAGAVLKLTRRSLPSSSVCQSAHAGHAAIAASASVRGHGEVWAHRHDD
jgi:hypothetical protein